MSETIPYSNNLNPKEQEVSESKLELNSLINEFRDFGKSFEGRKFTYTLDETDESKIDTNHPKIGAIELQPGDVITIKNFCFNDNPSGNSSFLVSITNEQSEDSVVEGDKKIHSVESDENIKQYEVGIFTLKQLFPDIDELMDRKSAISACKKQISSQDIENIDKDIVTRIDLSKQNTLSLLDWIGSKIKTLKSKVISIIS